MIGDILLDVLGYTTARILVPIVPFGRVHVQRLASEPQKHNWLGLARRPDGTHQIEAGMAGWYGLFFWIALLIAAPSLLR